MLNLRLLAVVAVAIAMTAVIVVPNDNVSATSARAGVAAPTPDKAPFFEFKGVTIGNKAEMVWQKLGEPKEKGTEQDLYVFSENESAQFYYDSARLVTAIMITYTGDLKAALTPLQVFGEAVEPRSDGGINKMVRYPKAGYWISYNRSAGDDAVISIAIQKL
jgi:hypothetical protein